MFASHNIKARSAFIIATIGALLIAISPNLHAQSPLTVQPSTGRVGVGNTSPTETVDVTGTVKATTFKGDGSQLTNLPQGSQWTTSGSNIYYNGSNVGVGNTSPGYKLDVTGTVNATAFRGDGSALTNLPGGGGSGALDKVTANTTVNNTSTDTNLYSFSVAGGTLSTNNVLRLTLQISDIDLLDGDLFVLRLKYGGTTLASVTIGNGTGNVFSNGQGLVDVVIAADGATNAQIGTLLFNGSSTILGAGLGQGTSTTNSTSSQTLAVTVSWNNASTSVSGAWPCFIDYLSRSMNPTQ